MISLAIELYVLAMLDTAFSGICAASGRNALINKKTYYARSMWHGLLWGQVACVLGLIVLTLAVSLSGNRDQAISDMLAVGRRMAFVYWIYAATVILMFGVRAIPSVDVRSLTSTLAFGPLTFIRPLVILIGICWGLLTEPTATILIASFVIGMMMMPFRIFLNQRFASMDCYRNVLNSPTRRSASL